VIEARAVELLSDLLDHQMLTTIPGFGPIKAMAIPAEAGDLRQFRHHRQFLKFCGMDIANVQSVVASGARTRVALSVAAGFKDMLCRCWAGPSAFARPLGFDKATFAGVALRPCRLSIALGLPVADP